jgi:malate synthase
MGGLGLPRKELIVFAIQTEPARATGPAPEVQKRILTPEAIRFLVKLAKLFEPRRSRLLEMRRERQECLDAGEWPDFRPETAEVRRAHWKVAECPADLLDRRVEIIGPTDRKVILDGLNSGAKVFVADFEDSNSPTWENMIEGQAHLCDAVRGAITYDGAEQKHCELRDPHAVLMVRPRGWHLVEKHFLVEGEPISASLFDFGLFLFHNARALLGEGSGPYFYLPKLESALEARLWNDVFLVAQRSLGISSGTIRATVLIETIPAAFDMDEILWELREHASGLSCGRQDYVFSYIKKFRSRAESVLPACTPATMRSRFLAACTERLIATCHRRGAHAIGSMAAQLPKGDPQANAAVLAALRDDKLREVWARHDGTQVAHPALVPLAKAIFDTYMPEPNQVDRPTHCAATASDLLCAPTVSITAAEVDRNVGVGLRYLASWLSGNGCVAIDHQVENVATAEICRAQLWQWIRHGATLDDGRRVTAELVKARIDEHVEKLNASNGASTVATAMKLYEESILTDEFPDFLTLIAYDHLD